MSGLDANGRVDKALRLLTPVLQPIIERELQLHQGFIHAHGGATELPALQPSNLGQV